MLLKCRKYPDSYIGSLYNVYKKAARKRRRRFELTYDQFDQLVQKACHYCGDPGEWRTNGSGSYTAFVNGIDRVDNSKGYVIDNVVSCCKKCNASKHARPVTAFLKQKAERRGRFANASV